MPTIDPDVELLADIPILGADEDLLARRQLAVRLAELVMAAPGGAPRVIALTGPCGTGKSSVLCMLSEAAADHHDLALVSLDAQLHPSAETLMLELATDLEKLFSQLGVANERDKVRDTLVNYGGVVSSVIGLAGVKVNVSSVLGRSGASLRLEIGRNLERATKRLLVVIDHVDHLPPQELRSAFAALRMYATIPNIAVVIAVDRQALAMMSSLDRRAFERLVDTELVMPAADRTVLARVIAGGLKRIAVRTGSDVEPALALFAPPDGLGLALIDTPRDAKRAINALSAGIPLLPPDADLREMTLEILLRVLVPELDAARLEARHVTAQSDREALFAELVASIAGHPRATAAREALRGLIIGR